MSRMFTSCHVLFSSSFSLLITHTLRVPDTHSHTSTQSTHKMILLEIIYWRKGTIFSFCHYIVHLLIEDHNLVMPLVIINVVLVQTTCKKKIIFTSQQFMQEKHCTASLYRLTRPSLLLVFFWNIADNRDPHLLIYIKIMWPYSLL